MPKEIKDIIKENKDKKWTVSKFVPTNTYYKYGEEYKADGRSVFSLLWHSFVYKPNYTIA